MRKVLNFIKYGFIFLFQKLFWFFNFSSFCAVCGERSEIYPVCKDCEKSRFAFDLELQERCSVCGRILISEKGVCVPCRNERLLKNVDFVFPLFSYKLWNEDLLIRWKLGDERSLSFFFAKLARNALLQLKKKCGDFSIVPVPPRPGKIKQKGWDQIEELCSILEVFYNFKILRILERINNVQQKSLDKKNRLLTIGHNFKIKKEVKSINGNFCILDDVITTGSTIESISRELKSFGAKKVYALSLFTVDE